MRSMFASLDRDGDGFLSLEEVREGLAKRGIAVSTAHLEKLFAAMDANADARVSATEFDAFCEERRGAIRRAFVSVDRDENGEVDSEELRCGVERAGLKISDAQLRDVFEKLDKDKSGTLSEKEFEEALMLLPKGANPAAVFDAFLRASFVDDAESHCSACKDLPPRGGGSLAWAVAMKMASGGVAGAVSRTATAPIDRVKTILQTGRRRVTIGIAARAVYAEGGVRAFFRGNGANVLKVVPETAVKFAAFDLLKRTIATDPGNVTIAERFAAGGLAGVASQALVYPLEVIKTRLAVTPPGSAGGDGIAAMASHVVAREGARGLFRGLAPSVVGIFPYAGIDLMANSILKDALARRCEGAGKEPGVVQLLGCGMASSTTAMLCTYPLNLIRTKLQTSGMEGAVKYAGPVDCFRRVVAKDGLGGLYRGVAPNLAKVLPATSVSYAVYDVLSRNASDN
ncbi:uncharacterized protein MICPUCDRAFT_14714 [Micromonas pusilla CCMP1545]|uniref:Predicted protein n=1 Tax=Micromonas pusilla (strain CCMP1545) TaxID=564608 RepID=C1MMX5_MICPC|nr:uncharacterized protein MICPUCDRAFT_14714 [Micromonas pusilla CCMP1545]EEH58646.1 predicted protein [Micromonas pusilla CCMP1545]|eukprot:XP_003057001.1 predicted protein [Micromonas pusilla CCMP1545]